MVLEYLLGAAQAFERAASVLEPEHSQVFGSERKIAVHYRLPAVLPVSHNGGDDHGHHQGDGDPAHGKADNQQDGADYFGAGRQPCHEFGHGKTESPVRIAEPLDRVLEVGQLADAGDSEHRGQIEPQRQWSQEIDGAKGVQDILQLIEQPDHCILRGRGLWWLRVVASSIQCSANSVPLRKVLEYLTNIEVIDAIR